MMYETMGLIVQEKKMNIKKVAIFIVTILLCSFTIFISFYISYTSMNKNKNYSATPINEVKTVTGKNNKEKDKEKDKNSNIYDGRHMQIAAHDMDIISSKIVEESKAAFNPDAKEEIRNIYFSEEKQVYLTFDDGPSRDVTPQILDILREENVPATFFVLGSRAEVYQDILKRAYHEGHYIANHGYSHKYSLIYERPENVLDEYIRTEEIIRNILQVPDYQSYLFRFPGGSTAGRYAEMKKHAANLLEASGIVHTNWNSLTGDAEGVTTKEGQLKKFFTEKGDKSSLIVLMHDANDKGVTVEVIRELIPQLKNEGYVFKNFYDIFRKE